MWGWGTGQGHHICVSQHPLTEEEPPLRGKMSSALSFELGKQSEDSSSLFCAIPPFSEMTFKQKKAERLKMKSSSKKKFEKVVQLMAQIAASERPRKLSGQSDNVTVTGGAGSFLSCFCLPEAFFSLMKSVYRGQRALNTSSIVQYLSVFL